MYYKVYANCVRRPKGLAIINIDNDYAKELLEAIDKIFDNRLDNGSIDTKLRFDENGDITMASMNNAYADVSNECISNMEEYGYIRVGDYMLVDSNKADIKRPDIIGWGD